MSYEILALFEGLVWTISPLPSFHAIRSRPLLKILEILLILSKIPLIHELRNPRIRSTPQHLLTAGVDPIPPRRTRLADVLTPRMI